MRNGQRTMTSNVNVMELQFRKFVLQDIVQFYSLLTVNCCVMCGRSSIFFWWTSIFDIVWGGLPVFDHDLFHGILLGRIHFSSPVISLFKNGSSRANPRYIALNKLFMRNPNIRLFDIPELFKMVINSWFGQI